MPTSVWITFKGIVVKAAPEQLRHASSEEQMTMTGWINDIAETRKEMEKKVTHGYIDLTQEEHPDVDETAPDYDFVEEMEVKPQHRLKKKTKVEDVPHEGETDEQRHWRVLIAKTRSGLDYWLHLPSVPSVRRVHVQPREHLWHPEEAADTCPVSITEMTGARYSLMTRSSDGLIAEKQDDFRELVASELTEMNGETWTGYTEFPLMERRDEVTMSRDLSGAPCRTPPKLNPLIEEDTTEIVDKVNPEEKHDTESLKEEESGDAEAPDVGDFKRAAEDDLEAEQPAKRHRTQFLELFHQTVEQILEAKKQKEINFRDLSGDYKEKFHNAMRKEIKNNIETGAYEPMTLEESEQVRRDMPEKVLQSRYVLVEKPIEESDVAKAREDKILLADNGELSTKAKARHVMKGFSEWDAEGLDVSTPQVAKESITFLLQILCSLRWMPGYLDFTQAFHSGDQIQRTLFAEQPTEGIPGLKPRQLLRLKKCCYGLLDGPYQWYVHLKRLLTEELGSVCLLPVQQGPHLAGDHRSGY